MEKNLIDELQKRIRDPEKENGHYQKLVDMLSAKLEHYETKEKQWQAGKVIRMMK